MHQITVGSLFTGIGVFDLGLERVLKARTLWQVERESFCLRVLEKHWPDVPRHLDVCTASALPFVDIICGGFPCQDISAAGKGGGIDGERSGLWREFARIIEETAPRVVAIENSPLLSRRGLHRVLGDLAALGYLGTWGVVAAADAGSCHQRDRLFIVAAHPERVALRDEQGWRGGACWTGSREPRHVGAPWTVADADVQRVDLPAGPQQQRLPIAAGAGEAGGPADADRLAGGQRRTADATEEQGGRHVDRGPFGAWRGWVPASPVRRVDDGVAAGVDRPRWRRPAGDRHRLKALGNAIVLPVAEAIADVIDQLVDFEAVP